MKYIQTFESFVAEDLAYTKSLSGKELSTAMTWDFHHMDDLTNPASSKDFHSNMPTLFSDQALDKMSNQQFQDHLREVRGYVSDLQTRYEYHKSFKNQGDKIYADKHKGLINKMLPYLTKITNLSKDRIENSAEGLSKEQINSDMKNLLAYYETRQKELDKQNDDIEAELKTINNAGSVKPENKDRFNQLVKNSKDLEAEQTLIDTQTYIIKKNLR